MADVKITVDSSDLQLLTDWLNKTDQKVKVLTKSAENNFQTFKKQRQELENVRRSLDPLYAATVDFEAKLEVLNRELKDTAPAEYARRLEQLRKQAQRAGLQVNNMNKVIGMSNKGTRRFELGMQQAGYQVQDFIVQVQSGTNPLIAFSQQGSQLAGFFAGPWGAAIGVGIAALSSFAIGVMAANGEVKDLAEELDELESLNDALDSFGETFGQKFIGNIEAVRETFGSLVANIYEQEIRDVQSAIEKTFKMGFGAGFAESAAGSDGLYRQVEETGIMGIPTQGAFKAAKELDRRKAEIQNILNSLSSTDIVSKEALANAFAAAYAEMENLGYVSDEYLTQLERIAIENGLHVKHIESIGEAQDEANKKAKVTDDQRV